MQPNGSGIFAKERSLSTRTILIASHEEGVRTSLAVGLASAGFSTIDVKNGQDALDFCRQNPPALAILDNALPHLTGIAVAQHLRSSHRLPIVILATQEDESILDRTFDAGAMACLMKPVAASLLVATVHTALRHFVELVSLRAETLRLDRALQQTQSTSVAVGILMAQLHLSERDAYDRLRLFARSTSTKVTEVALRLVTRAGEFHSVITEIAAMSPKARGSTNPLIKSS